MTKILGIIGYPIGHSISPVFQQAALDACGIDATYTAWEVLPAQVGQFVAGLRRPEVLGINVTVPHKEAVIPHLDEVDDWARTAGAVNTIVNRNGRLTGHNTDGYGFLQALKIEGGFDPAGRRVLLLGAGGAARGVVLALLRADVGHLTIANRTPERAAPLAELARREGVAVEVVPLAGAALDAAAARAALIVNSTSVGMRHGPDEHGTPLAAAQIPSGALVYDLVYNPLETPLLREAARAGARPLGGILMLVCQGVASFEMWTGRPAPVPVMLEAATRAMAARAH